MLAEGASFQEVVLEPAIEFPRMRFGPDAGRAENGRGRPADLHRRLRDRVLVTLLSEELPDRPAQDRPVLRPGHRDRPRRRGHRHCGDRAGA